MSKLHQIINAVTANGMREWTDERAAQAMREFAKSVAEDALKRAAEADSSEENGGWNFVSKQSILSTPINLEL